MITLSKSAEPAGAQAPATACRNCGSQRFTVVESYSYEGAIEDEGDGGAFLLCFDSEGGVASITCQECEAPYEAHDFAAIVFC